MPAVCCAGAGAGHCDWHPVPERPRAQRQRAGRHTVPGVDLLQVGKGLASGLLNCDCSTHCCHSALAHLHTTTAGGSWESLYLRGQPVPSLVTIRLLFGVLGPDLSMSAALECGSCWPGSVDNLYECSRRAQLYNPPSPQLCHTRLWAVSWRQTHRCIHWCSVCVASIAVAAHCSIVHLMFNSYTEQSMMVRPPNHCYCTVAHTQQHCENVLFVTTC